MFLAWSWRIRILAAVFASGILISSCKTASPSAKRSVSISNEQAARLFGGGGKIDSSYRERRSREYFLRGSSLQMEKRHAEAILDFQMALRYDSSAVTFYALAKNYAELDRHDAAIEYAKAAILKDSTFLPALETAGRSYIALGDFEKAAGIYEKLSDLDTTARQYRFMLARIYEALDPAKAEAIYKTLLDASGDNERVLRRLAEIYRSQDGQNQYTATLEQLYDETGEPDINELLIAEYCSSQNFDKAITALARTSGISSPEDISRLYGAVGQAMLETRGVDSSAKNLFQHYTELASQERFFDWQTNMIAGMAAYSSGNAPETAKYFDRAITAAANPDIAYRAGMFYLQNEDYSNASALLSKYDSIFAESKLALYAGYAYASSGDYGKALNILRRGVERDSSNVEIWAQLGLIFDRLGRTPESEAAYESALKIDPNHALANNNLAYSLAARGVSLKRALSLAEKALQAQPLNAAFLDTYGWALYGMGSYESAKEYLEKAADSAGASPNILNHLGDCYSKLGLSPAAAAAYKKAKALEIERNPFRR